MKTPIVLASASPRRRELLASAGISCLVNPAHIPEVRQPGEAPEAYGTRLASEKAAAVAPRHPDHIVLAADTLVVLNGEVLEKPADAADAVRKLSALSGRTHEVLTAVCLRLGAESRSFLCRTEVDFRVLDKAEILRYVATGEPMDKAGGYGIQAGAAHMVRAIRGSYSNVVGLPMAEVIEALRSFPFSD